MSHSNTELLTKAICGHSYERLPSLYIIVCVCVCVYVCVYVRGLAKPVVEKVTKLRLSMDDFDTLEIIGRGAFGEVKVRTGFVWAG